MLINQNQVAGAKPCNFFLRENLTLNKVKKHRLKTGLKFVKKCIIKKKI